jgi:hypothetical protein
MRALSSSRIALSVASLALRRSTVMCTSPGTTFLELGLTCMKPTVPRA